jgi:Ca2+-binding EF-hand superfamily protein
MNYTEAQLMETFRKKLAARGSRGIMGLGRQFKIADDNQSGGLDIDEFKKCVHDFRIGLKPSDSERLFKIFDRDNGGSIDYEEFLRGVRGEMNEFRKGFTQKAFKIMDKDNSGTIDINDIRQRYNAK